MNELAGDGGEGGDGALIFAGVGGDCRFGKGGPDDCCFSRTMHSLSSSPSNIVSIARFFERVGDADLSVLLEGD